MCLSRIVVATIVLDVKTHIGVGQMNSVQAVLRKIGFEKEFLL